MTTFLPGTPGPRPILGPAPEAPITDLDAALDAGAFSALRRVVGGLGPTATVATIVEADLRGRGGAGYPAGKKWHAVLASADPVRHVVANGYEADPGQGTNRLLMETRPFAVVEGVAIAALAVGAREAIIAVRAEYAAAVRALESAVGAAEGAGFLGTGVLGSALDVVVRVQPVRGAYMLGEETALLAALEGRRAEPEQRPPYPAERGLFGHPTLVHNVVTLATIPWIVLNGAAAFRAIGDPGAPGTVLVQVSGAVATPGIAEIATGTRLRDILAAAGGMAPGRDLKAVLVGGPSGAFLAPDRLATPYTFTDLRTAGAHVGSGAIVVADGSTCLVDLARLLTRFSGDEACGKTIPCRIGLRRIAEIGQRIADGTTRPTDEQLLEDLAADCAASALCDHERLAPGPLLSLVRSFRSEVDDHVVRGVCAAGVCTPVRLAPARPATEVPAPWPT